MKTCPRCGTEYSETITLCPADGSVLETTGDPLVGETLAGKYRIEERLSVGGMGTVYRATHILMDKKVAIKVLRPSLAADEKIVARFSREARAASRISHPNALSVTDFGEADGGVVFLVMEFLSGRTLKQVIRQEGPLPLARVVEIIRQVGSALAVAHSEGVIHRDLKSENIMLLDTNGPDYAKVLDFGIAKIQEPIDGHDSALTSPDLIIGTPQYMSPEQCSQAESLDTRSDVYSLGVILFEMLAGRVPFTGDSPTVIMLKHLQEAPPSVLECRNDLPQGVGVVVSRALAKSPEDRYQSVSELVEDFVIASGAGLVQAQPASEAANQDVVPKALAASAQDVSEIDEETLVRPHTPPVARPAPRVPAVVSSFNPWRIIIPSLAGLLVVFAVIYAFTRTSEPANTNQQGGTSTLSADPNSQAVQPAAPPTGKSEQGIPSGGAITTNANVSSSANANANADSVPSPIENQNANANANTNENKNENKTANANGKRAPELPTPKQPGESNTNQPAKPSPEPTKPRATPTLPPVAPEPPPFD
jgi:eukaryotic-like serine/threonine-protein kinase